MGVYEGQFEQGFAIVVVPLRGKQTTYFGAQKVDVIVLQDLWTATCDRTGP